MYQWSLSDTSGDPFKSFEWTRKDYFYQSSHGVRRDLMVSDYQKPTFFCSFTRTQSGGTVSCPVHFAVPNGAQPAGGIDVNLTSHPFTVQDMRLAVTSYSQNWLTSPGLRNPTARDGAVFSGTMQYQAQVVTPQAYVQGSDAGGWLWMQTLALGSTRTLNDGATVETQ